MAFKKKKEDRFEIRPSWRINLLQDKYISQTYKTCGFESESAFIRAMVEGFRSGMFKFPKK